MKDTISNNDLLLIRACKSFSCDTGNIKKYNIIKRVVGRKFALYKEHVDHGVMFHALWSIVSTYGLIKRMEEFLMDDLNPKKLYWFDKRVYDYHENLVGSLISKIACSRVDQFPRYPRPAWFKNKYPEKNDVLELNLF